MRGMSMNKSSLLFTSIAMAITLSFVAGRGSIAADKASPAEKSAAPTMKPKAVKGAKAGAEEMTLKGDMSCAKCDLHESKTCQNVLRVKDAAGGKETKYYLAKNPVSDQNHAKVCSASAPATVTGKVSDEGGKKVLAASVIKFD
jgi:hypothetical protein